MTVRVPPTLAILDSENLGAVEKPEDLHRLLKRGLVKDLRVQAENTLGDASCYELELPPPGMSFSLSPGASLDPFSRLAKCNAISCLRDRTIRFSQTLGLFADAIVIPDPFTPLFRKAEPSPELAIQLFTHLQVLQVLRPLVDHGIVKFGSPGIAYCGDCASKVSSKIEEAARQSAQDVVEQARFEVLAADDKSCTLAFESPAEEDGLLRVMSLRGSGRTLVDGYRLVPGRPLARSAVRRLRPRIVRAHAGELIDALIHLQRAESDGTHFATGSQHDVRLLHELGRAVAAESEASQVNAFGDVQLPWISGLTPEQIVALRAEAHSALPRFRTYVAEALAGKSLADSVIEVQKLRYAAVEAEAELIAASSSKLRQKVITAGGIGLAVFGAALGSDAAIAAVGTIVAAAAALHPAHGVASREIQKLKSDPSFVLVKAKQIFEDTHR